MLKPASAKFRRFPAEFRRFHAACFCTELDFEKTLPGKLKTLPTIKRRLFPIRQKLLPIWVVQVCPIEREKLPMVIPGQEF